MNKQRNVVLFGAGAVLGWNAPSTSEITEIVRKAGFKTVSGNETITEFIYQLLQQKGGYAESDINFETIINVIEELIVYYSYFDGRRKLPTIFSIFFSAEFENEILNYTIEGGDLKHGYRLEIPRGQRFEFGKNAINDETPAQLFFQQLLAEILTDIVARITDYASHTKNNSEVITAENTLMNNLFSEWIHRVAEAGIIRLYTLNYDRNFKIILEKASPRLTLFEGFDCDDTLEYGSRLKANIPRILSDTGCHSHYNLHGSIFWEVEARDASELPNPSFYMTESPVLAVNDYEHGIWQSERGKTIMLTNIITGYQKTQRGIFPPFKQMQAAFDRDCCFADTLYIVGYSFGDEHINASIRLAVQYNKNLKLTIVDTGFTKNDFDLHVAVRIFSAAGEMHAMKPTSIDRTKHVFYDGKFTVHTKTFKAFLETSVADEVQGSVAS